MKIKSILIVLAILAMGLPACKTSSAVGDTPVMATSTEPPPAFTATPHLTEPPTQPDPSTTPEENKFIFDERGPYSTGYRSYSLIDESRANREIRVTIWYPAVDPPDSANSLANQVDAPPYLEGAPYPVIMTGRNSGDYLYCAHLASHGFAMVIVRSPGFNYEAPWNQDVIDAPLDFLFALDSLSTHPPEGLEGMLDTDRVGVAGYSSDGLFALALGGARINPDYYFSQCANAPTLDPPLSPFLTNYLCKLSGRWDDFSLQVNAEISTLTNGLWQPTTDSRILAIMPMAPDSAWLYGPEGLAAVKIPALLIAGTADDLCSYQLSSSYIYDHLVNADRILISFIDQHHMMVENPEIKSRIQHFTVAFFGLYLQGRADYADYFSQDFVSQFDDLFWGVYPDE